MSTAALCLLLALVASAVSAEDVDVDADADAVARCRSGRQEACVDAIRDALADGSLFQLTAGEVDAGVQRLVDHLKSREISFGGSEARLVVSPQRLDRGELDVTFQFDAREDDETREGRSKIKKKIKKSKLKKILVPIAILVLLKALTLVPLLLGALGLKAWNALQLGFGSFVVSLGLAVWQLCQKLAGEAPHVAVASVAPVSHAAHAGWDGRDGRDLAYRAYAP